MPFDSKGNQIAVLQSGRHSVEFAFGPLTQTHGLFVHSSLRKTVSAVSTLYVCIFGNVHTHMWLKLTRR